MDKQSIVMDKQGFVMSEQSDIICSNGSIDEDEFDVYYSIVLEDLSISIKKHLGLYFSDHALYRLCKDLEQELKKGENCYE